MSGCNGVIIPFNVGGVGYGCGCGNLPPACNCPPSPNAPWQRESMSPLIQTLYDGAVAISLDPNTCYLNQTQTPTAPINTAMVLPNGNFPKQSMSIFIVSSALATTATWTFSGTFAGGYTKLMFNNFGFSALLFWDGSAWQLTGGNAILTA